MLNNALHTPGLSSRSPVELHMLLREVLVAKYFSYVPHAEEPPDSLSGLTEDGYVLTPTQTLPVENGTWFARATVRKTTTALVRYELPELIYISSGEYFLLKLVLPLLPAFIKIPPAWIMTSHRHRPFNTFKIKEGLLPKFTHNQVLENTDT